MIPARLVLSKFKQKAPIGANRSFLLNRVEVSQWLFALLKSYLFLYHDSI